MKVELKANGKTVQVEMTEEQAKILGLVEERSRTGYERVEVEETYYLVEVDDEITNMKHNGQLDRDCYDVGNYYSNKTIAENNARADRLLRHLRQWQAQNDEPISVEDWNNECKKKWLLYIVIVLKKCTQSIIILCDYLIQYISPPKKKPKKLSKYSKMN